MLIFLHTKKKNNGDIKNQNNGDIKNQVHHDPFISNSQREIEIHCIFWVAPSRGFQSYSEPMSPFPETISVPVA